VIAGHDLDMPVHRQAGTRVELAKTIRGKARKVVTQQRGALASLRVRGDGRPAWSAGWFVSSGSGWCFGRFGCLGHDLAAQVRDKQIDDLPVGCRQFLRLARCCGAGLLLDSFIRSNSILVARRLALADSLTICVMIA
jgi:hypothetical protein